MEAADSFAKALAARQRSFDSLTEAVLDDRRALDYLELSKAGSVLGQHYLLYLDQRFVQITERAIWLKRMSPFVGSFLDWFGSCRLWP